MTTEFLLGGRLFIKPALWKGSGGSRPRNVSLLMGLTILVTVWPGVRGEDWPTYQHDGARSAATSERLALPLAPAWVYRSAVAPAPAWDEPAIWDGYNKVYGLSNRQVFDKALHTICVGDAVYFGSSVDDQVYCLAADTGDVRWRFFTEGPVRLAPTHVNGRIYVGSDDGSLYCLQASTGELVWKQHVAPVERRVPGNERLISLWPVRAGICVTDGVVYCAAGVFPSENVYLSAFDAGDGRRVWQTQLKDFPAQGYMLVSAERLYVTTGRNRPLVFNRLTGERLFQVPGGRGGSYALLTGDTLVYGPGKTGQIAALGESGRDELATFDGNHLVIVGPDAYLHTPSDLTRMDRQRRLELSSRHARLIAQRDRLAKALEKGGANVEATRAELTRVVAQLADLDAEIDECLRWRVACDCPLSLIVAGPTVFAGGDGKVAAFDTASGRQFWQARVDGKAFGLAAANGCLLVSTDRGAIHCFVAAPPAAAGTKPQEAAVALPVRSTDESQSQPPRVVAKTAAVVASPLVHGPFVRSVNQRRWRISWDTIEPITSAVEVLDEQGKVQRVFEDQQATTEHTVEMTDLPRDGIHTFRLSGRRAGGTRLSAAAFDLDTMLHYGPREEDELDRHGFGDAVTDQQRALAQTLLDAGTDQGYALIVGGDGTLAAALAAASRLQVIVVNDDAEVVDRAREKLASTGLYGHRISVHHADYARLAYGPFFANLVSCPAEALAAAELPVLSRLAQLVRPTGGLLAVPAAAADVFERALKASADGEFHRTGRSKSAGFDGAMWRRDELAGAGQWTHPYGLPSNTSCSEDEIIRGDMSVLWWGRPGPRPMPDRGPRNPPPVSAHGRLFVQGNRTLFGLDAYNGTILWFRQVPFMRRANLPRDGSNMVAMDDELYVAMGPYVVGFDGASGRRKTNFRVPQLDDGEQYDWGYLAATEDTLFGSCVRRGATFLGDDGEWYNDFGPDQIARVCSRALFAIDRQTGQQKWFRTGGVVMNSTLAVAGDSMFFVESRSPQALGSETDRLFDEVQQEQFLVALDTASGRVRWERPVDFSRCEFMTYVTVALGKILVVGSDRDRQFHLHAFETQQGESLWQQMSESKKTHHSGQLDHPVVIEDRIYLNKQTWDLHSGNVLNEESFDWHGCGIMSASCHSIFRRYEYHGMLDLHTQKRTEFLGTRSGCWLSLIPSGGIVLAPETSAGCSCTHALQTSMAYVPVALLPGNL